MELPANVIVNSNLPDLKGMEGELIAVSEHGYYEIIMKIREKRHTYLLPIAQTVLVCTEAVLEPEPGFEVER
jgi:hypothetical protein